MFPNWWNPVTKKKWIDDWTGDHANEKETFIQNMHFIPHAKAKLLCFLACSCVVCYRIFLWFDFGNFVFSACPWRENRIDKRSSPFLCVMWVRWLVWKKVIHLNSVNSLLRCGAVLKMKRFFSFLFLFKILAGIWICERYLGRTSELS